MASQDEIKGLFHSIANWLYKITIKTGSLTGIAKIKSERGMSEAELKEEFTKLLGALSEVQEYALKVSDDFQKLKVSISAELKITPDEDK